MRKLSPLFTQIAQKHNTIADDFTVMFADLRHGMDAKTAQAFKRLKARAAGRPHAEKYVAKIEAAVAKHAPQVLAGKLQM